MAANSGTHRYAAQWNAATCLVLVKLDKTKLWRKQIRSVIKSQGLLKFVDGLCSAPSQYIEKENNRQEPNPVYEEWERAHQLTLSWIRATVSEQVLEAAGKAISDEDAVVAFSNMEGIIPFKEKHQRMDQKRTVKAVKSNPLRASIGAKSTHNTIYSPRLDSPPPRWVHIAHGLLLFLYQRETSPNG
ncbi:Choline/ethanolaminephosphotransferase 2 [Nymphaea thermarum]|nr:Choline/ethanolaminephosphotransferase 2 [Nymphaea thermarum]